MTAPVPLAVRRFRLVAVIVPAVLVAAAVVVQLILLPRVPASVAMHWGIGGAPDGFAPAGVQPVMTAVVGGGIPALIAVTTLPGLVRGDRGSSYRLMGALAAAVAVLMSVLGVGGFLLQVGLTDAGDAGSIVPVLLAAFAAAILAGTGGWFLQPREEVRASAVTPAALPLAETEGVAWFAETTIARGGMLLIGSAVLAVTGGALAAWLASPEPVAAVVLTIVALVLLVAVGTTTAFRVRVDADGLTVRSVLGFPRFSVPLVEVRGVSVVDVHPMGEFGGWGLRAAPGRFGVVLRSGPAIEVDRVGRSRLVVAVPDAVTGAALLRTLAERAQSTGTADAR